jgi:hypothetical protein
MDMCAPISSSRVAKAAKVPPLLFCLSMKPLAIPFVHHGRHFTLGTASPSRTCGGSTRTAKRDQWNASRGHPVVGGAAGTTGRVIAAELIDIYGSPHLGASLP